MSVIKYMNKQKKENKVYMYITYVYMCIYDYIYLYINKISDYIIL